MSIDEVDVKHLIHNNQFLRNCKHFVTFGHRSQLSTKEPCKEKFRPNRIDQVFCSKACSTAFRDKRKLKIENEKRKVNRAVVVIIKALDLDPDQDIKNGFGYSKRKDVWIDIACTNGFDCLLKRIVEVHCK